MDVQTETNFAATIAQDALRVHDAECCTHDKPCVIRPVLEAKAGLENVVSQDSGDDGVRKRREAGGRAGNQYGTFQVHYPSPAQIRFIQNLVDGREIPATGGEQVALKAFRAGTLNKRHASDLIEWLMTLPEKAGMVNFRPASSKQIYWIRKIQDEKEFSDEKLSAIIAKADSEISMGDAKYALDILFNSPDKVQKTPGVDVGIYRVNNVIYRVKQSKTGNLYAQPFDENTHKFGGYAPGMMREIRAEHRLSLDEVIALSIEFTQCMACGLELTNEVSIERGIGPICRAKMGY